MPRAISWGTLPVQEEFMSFIDSIEEMRLELPDHGVDLGPWPLTRKIGDDNGELHFTPAVDENLQTVGVLPDDCRVFVHVKVKDRQTPYRFKGLNDSDYCWTDVSGDPYQETADPSSCTSGTLSQMVKVYCRLKPGKAKKELNVGVESAVSLSGGLDVTAPVTKLIVSLYMTPQNSPARF
eukprot:TRINITY_DN68110_c1_g1_i2.p1 TRINITY_DN68110_c1_g1~~TRINITY_DN68110_c1_g1_i2.p1  ORF type:complete len:180 (+),score=5.57 TRINITY_DN68110_c1_g1_i2:72-611(+)